MTEGIELPEGRIIDVQNNYKYLRIPQANSTDEEPAQRAAMAKYLRKVRQIQNSQLNGKNILKEQAINTDTLPIIRYPAGIITTGREPSHRYQHKKTYNAWRLPPQIH